MEQRETIIVLDYGSQYTQLIARRVREQHVYCHIYPWNAAQERVMAHQPMGFILSGGPNSVYEPGAPTLPRYIPLAGVPILGLCYGMQLLARSLGKKGDSSRNSTEIYTTAGRTLSTVSAKEGRDDGLGWIGVAVGWTAGVGVAVAAGLEVGVGVLA